MNKPSCGTIHQAATPSGGRHARRGFSLIEFLVVLAVIALLAALIFPVIAAAREKGRRIACVSNMHQLGLALLLYTQDNDERQPNGMFYNRFPLNIGWAGRIYPYVKQVDVFHCPDDPTGSRDGPAHSRAYPVSYALNLDLSMHWDWPR